MLCDLGLQVEYIIIQEYGGDYPFKANTSPAHAHLGPVIYAQRVAHAHAPSWARRNNLHCSDVCEVAVPV